MAIVKPFKGVTYNLEKVLLKKVISPPLGWLTENDQHQYMEKSFYNVAHLFDLKRASGDIDVSQMYSQWKQETVLIKEPLPVFYLCEQQYTIGDETYTRTGFTGLVKLTGDEGHFTPFVNDYSMKVDEHFELMKAAKANMNQVLGLYHDGNKKLENLFTDIKKNMPVLSAVDDSGCKNTIWIIESEETIQLIESYMKDKNVLITEGCDSYRSSLKYCEYMRKQHHNTAEDLKAYDFAMMTFFNLHDEGTKVFNSVRKIEVDEKFDQSGFMEKLKEKFEVLPSDGSIGEDFSLIMTFFGETYGLVIEDEILEKLHPVYRRFDAYVLHQIVLEDILKVCDEDAGVQLTFVDETDEASMSDSCILFEIQKDAKQTVLEISEYGSLMLGRSVYSVPKLQSGLLMNEI